MVVRVILSGGNGFSGSGRVEVVQSLRSWGCLLMHIRCVRETSISRSGAHLG